MKSIFSVLLICVITASLTFAQDITQIDTTQQEQQQKPEPEKQKPSFQRVYLGGNLALSVGPYTRIGVYPLIGYKLTPKLSGGLKIGYEYIRDNRW